MTLKHCIVHSIERTVPGAPVTTQLREKENPTTDASFSLFEQLKQTFQRSSQKQYGHFDREQGDNPLPGWLRQQREGSAGFVATSRRLLEHLQQIMEQHDEAFSAHILFAQESVMDEEQFYIFWINHIEASHIDAALDVATARYIDSGKLSYALRVFVDEWLEYQTRKYLTLITARGNKTLSDAFTRFVAFAEGLDVAEDTSEFLNIVDHYVDTLPEENSSDHKSRILDYCIEQDKVGAPVVFEDISSQLNDAAPQRFAEFVTEQQREPREQIYTDRRSLKRYMRYFGRDNAMSISFASELFGEDVIYDEQRDTLTLKRIPQSLKRQLRDHGTGADSDE